MKILYFGRYQKEYSRNKIIISGLKANNVEVDELHCTNIIWPFKLFFSGLKQDFDILFVGYPGHIEFFVGKLICFFKRKKIVLDKFYSIYDTFVLDRKKYSKKSIQAKILWHIDKLNCRLADKILLDTNENINFFVREFGVKKDKFARVFVGALQNKNKNKISQTACFNVLFYGTFIPLQGANIIANAGKMLDNQGITIELIGAGPTLDQCKQIVKENKTTCIKFTTPQKNNILKQKIMNADLCLGIFGKSGKTKRVIPNKVFDAIAAGKPVLTADTNAIRELFVPGQNCIVCSTGNEKELAKKILWAKAHLKQIKKIALEGKKVYNKKCTPKIIGKEVATILKKIA
jgi:glycosyltransferase involved in cell wall biosynthesis